MSVTLEEVLALEAFAGARVVAGRRGLKNNIRTVTVGEVPVSSQYLSGGELVLTSFYLFREMPGGVLAAVMQAFADSGAAGVVYKPCSAGRELSGQPLQMAEARGFPVIEIPEERRWPVLIEAVLERIQHQERMLLRRAWEIQHDLVRTVLSGGGLRGLSAALGRHLGCALELLDLQLRPVAEWTPAGTGAQDECVRAGFRNWLGQSDLPARAQASGEALQMVPPGQYGPPRVLLPVTAETRPLGFIALCTTTKRLGEIGLLAARETCSLAALEILKAREMERAEVSSRDQLLRRWLSDHGGDPDWAEEDSLLPYRGRVLIIRRWQKEPDNGAPAAVEPAQADVQAEVRRLTAPNTDPLVTDVDGDIVALLPCIDAEGSSDRTNELASRLHTALQSLWGPRTAPVLGLGRPCRTLADIRQSYRDAVRALELTTRVSESARPATWSDTALYDLLLRSPNPVDLERFCQSLLRPLAEYDRHHHSDLMGTLLTFLTSNRSLADTAERLRLHRNSVAYRLRKIRDITELNYDDPDQVVTWFLALRLPSLLSASAAVGGRAAANELPPPAIAPSLL